MDFKDSFLDYLQLERNYSARTITSYRIDLEKFEECFKEVDPSLSFVTVDSDVVRMWIAHLMDEGYTSTSANRKLSTLRSFYRFLLMKGVVDHNPLQSVHGPKNKKPLPSFLKESEMSALLDEAGWGGDYESVRNRCILELFYETGVRLSELVGLRDGDIDYGTHTLKVTGKRNKQRIIPFGPRMEESLADYCTVRDHTFPSHAPSLFLSRKGLPITTAQVYALVHKQLGRVCTLKKRSPHVLRHTFATAMVNHNAQLGAVKELLGHASLATTEIYTHTSFAELKKQYKLAHLRD